MIIGTDKCQFELYIINDDQYTDFEVGNKIYGERLSNGYDCFAEEVPEIVGEIAEKLYKECKGQFKYIIETCFEYTETYDYYYGVNEYDMNYEFVVITKEPTDYFDDIDES